MLPTNFQSLLLFYVCDVLPAPLSVHYLSAWRLRRPEEGVRAGGEPPWDLNPDPVGEQPVF